MSSSTADNPGLDSIEPRTIELQNTNTTNESHKTDHQPQLHPDHQYNQNDAQHQPRSTRTHPYHQHLPLSRYIDPNYPDQTKLVSRNNHVQILADRLSIALTLEFVGAAVITLARVWAGNDPYKLPAMGLFYFNMMVFGSHQSGGYFNPALVFGSLIRGKLNLIMFILYSFVNFLGAFAGGSLLWYFVLTPSFVDTKWGHKHITLLPQPHIGYWSIFWYEFFYMFWFAYFHQMMTSTWMSRNNVFYSIYMAGYYIVALGITVTVTPGLLNPAVLIGSLLPAGMEHGIGNLKLTWLYLLAEYGGALIGSGIFYIISMNDIKREFREAQHGNLSMKPY